MKSFAQGFWSCLLTFLLKDCWTPIDEGSGCRLLLEIWIVRGPEDYESLSICVINEILDIYNNGIEVDRNTYTVQFYLGADWNFLAMAFGIDSAALGACTPHTTMGTIRPYFFV